MVAVAPAVPLRQRGRRRGRRTAGGCLANVALAVGEGEFDIVHAHEPLVPGRGNGRAKHSQGLTAATFHADRRAATHLPGATAAPRALPGPHRRAAGDQPARPPSWRRVLPGRLRADPRPGVFERFRPGREARHPRGRRVDAREPAGGEGAGADGRRPPGVDADARCGCGAAGGRSARTSRPRARGRVHTRRPRGRRRPGARCSPAADVFVAAPDGDPPLTWEARASGCVVVAAPRDRRPGAADTHPTSRRWPPRRSAGCWRTTSCVAGWRPRRSAAAGQRFERGRWPNDWSRSTAACCVAARVAPRCRPRGRASSGATCTCTPTTRTTAPPIPRR